MVRNDNKPTRPGDQNEQNHINWPSSADGMDSQDQILVEALQQFIIPLVDATGDRTGTKERNQIILKPEAMKLVTALKEFISSVVRISAPVGGTTIQVSLDEDVREFESTEDMSTINGTGDELSELDEISDSNSRDDSSTVQDPEDTFHECVLRGLHGHVFDKMPIRLLRFVPQGSYLQISLAEKGYIYTHLASVIEAHRGKSDYQPKWINSGKRMETYDEAAARLIQKYAEYAVLSHTWLHASPGEVTYSNWTEGRLDEASTGYQKLVNFCKVAWKDHGLTLVWMDTICINKESSSELDESIRSMYNWYRRSKVCIVHLAKTQTLPNIHRDPWFTRGWTLQELLAPKCIKFYNQNWKRFVRHASSNDKGPFGSRKIRLQINQATTITNDELNHIFGTPLSRRMQLAASREVTREEDMAYSLMGIFNASIATAYGEGAERAFFRLLQAILNSTSSGVLDLFNCAGDISGALWHTSKMLPPSPKSYNHRSSLSNLSLRSMHPLAPLSLTHMGLHIPVVLMPGIFVDDHDIHRDPIGDYSATVTVASKRLNAFTISSLHLLDNRALPNDDIGPESERYEAAVFNIQQDSRGILIPRICIAKLVRWSGTGDCSVLETEMPVVFKMEIRKANKLKGKNVFCLAEDELTPHGMRFTSLYL